jgi:hypothetical protein
MTNRLQPWLIPIFRFLEELAAEHKERGGHTVQTLNVNEDGTINDAVGACSHRRQIDEALVTVGKRFGPETLKYRHAIGTERGKLENQGDSEAAEIQTADVMIIKICFKSGSASKFD